MSPQSDLEERNAAEQDLERARSEADEANLAKTTFLTSLSHDLRQPLQARLVLNASQPRSVDENYPLALLREQDVVLRLVANLLDAILQVNITNSGRRRVETSDVGIDPLFFDLNLSSTARRGTRVWSCECADPAR
jgi:signal transduction histidine kinase